MNKEVYYLKKDEINSYIEYIKEVFGYSPTVDSILKAMKNNKILIIKDDNKVVASAMIEKKAEYIKNKKYYYVSYLGVLKDYRRRGYATKIFKKIEELSNKDNIDYLELTSGNQRKAAHYFYKNNNFKIKDTTVFIKIY